MKSLLTTATAQEQLRDNLKALRLQKGFTQKGLSDRSGVSLSTLRKFEQTGLISLESLLKLLMVLDALGRLVDATKSADKEYSYDLKNGIEKSRKYGWRT